MKKWNQRRADSHQASFEITQILVMNRGIALEPLTQFYSMRHRGCLPLKTYNS
jgi:hypothetical protein